MSSNNPNYPYPRPQQQPQQHPQQHPSAQNHTHIQQSFSQQGNYGASRGGGGDVGGGGEASSASGRAEYAAERWPDYGAPQQHHGQYSPALQHVQGMASLGSAVPRPSSRTADVAPSSINSRTSTASPVPGRAVGAFNGGGSGGGGGGGGVAVGMGMAVGSGGGSYDQYTGAHYHPSQPSATTATANQGSSRTVTAGAGFGGYGSYGPHYTQSQPPTTIAEMQQQQQLRTAPQQRVAAPEYIDYTAAAAASSAHTHTHTPAATVSQSYTPLYQTADSIRAQQATSLYTPTPTPTPVYQNAAAAAGTTVPSSYEGTYTPVDPQSQRQQQQHRPRQPQAQPAAPAQQPGKQKQQPRAPQFQAVNQQQSRTSQFQAVKSPRYQQPAPAAMTQYSNAFSQQQQQQQQQQHQQQQHQQHQQQQQQQQEQPAIQRTPTPSSVAAPYHQPAPAISSQIQHTHVTPSQLHSPQLQSPQIHSPQMQTQSPHQAPTHSQAQPQAQIQQQQYQAPPPPSEPPTLKKAKPKSRAKKPQDTDLRAKTWEPTMPMLYRQALHQGDNYMPSQPTARGLAGGGGGVQPIDPQREQEQRQLIEAQARRIEADMQADMQARKKAEQASQQAYQEAQKRAHEAQQRAQQEVQQRAQQEQQARQQEAQLQENERQRQEQENMRVLQARQRQLEQQAGQEAHQMQAQIEAQYQANLQAQHQQQQQQQQQTEQHAQAPPQQANQAYPENQNYQAPPPEARSAAPPALSKELMEAQMKMMVERMRYYQSADPITFQQVWENVRKTGGGNNAGAITNGSASGAIMTRDGSASSGSGSGSGEDRRQHSNNINTFQQQQQQQQPVQSANTNTNDSVPAPAPLPPAPAPAPPAAAAAVVPVQQPAAVVAAPPAPASLRSPGILDIKTARAIGKYLLNHFGHSPPQATILELILSGTNFIVLCDRLEVMGYKPHRGNFSRFLLAEVDGEGEDAEEEQAGVEVVEIDGGESRVLGEVGDDQEQILRELNEARRSSPVVVEDVAGVTPERTVVGPAGAGGGGAAGAGSGSAAGEAAGEAGIKAKRGRGRPRKSTTQPQPQPQPQTQPQTQSAVEAEAPKTPSADEETATVVSSLPTPPSVAAVAFPPTSTFTAPPPLQQQQQQQQQSPQSPLSHTNTITNTTSLHTSNASKNKQFMPPLSGNITSHSTPTTEDMSSAEYIAKKYVPRRPTPRSVKARAAAAPALAERQFVAPPQTYRPPTPPRMVVDLEQDGTDVEMLDPPAPAPGSETESESGSGSESGRLIVKLRVQKPAASAPAPAPVPNPASVTIDLTGTTPEPAAAHSHGHSHSHNQHHHGMPAFGELCEADLEWGKSTHEASPEKRPVLIPIPIPLQPPAPAPAQAQAQAEPLIQPLKREKALVKHTYNPSTIARDILIVMGRHPEFRALNAHLESLRTIAGNEVDLATIRWDLLDPGPGQVSFGDDMPMEVDDMAMEMSDMADDEGEGGVAVAARAVPAASAASAAAKSLVKGKGVVAPPVAAGKGKKKKRASGSVLGASVASFGAHGGFTTAAGGSGGGGGGGAGSGSGSGNNNTAAAAPASAPAETPRTQTRAGNTNGGSTARTTSTLRTVMTPDAAAASSSSRNFSVIIQSPRAPTSGPSRPTPTTTAATNALKRKSTSHSPAPKKPARLRRTKARDDPPPSGFKVFKCRWEHCPAELHNFETLHAHVAHNHGKPDNGVYPCLWAGCSRPAPAVAKRRGTGAGGGTHPLEFDMQELWQRHMDEAHLDAVRRELGVGPAVGLYDRDAAVASDVDYLSDSHGRQVTPIARPAPEGYVFLPPPQVANRHLVRARLLGAGMEGDDDMEGIADRAAEASLGVLILRIARPDGAEGRAGGGGSSGGGGGASGSGGGGGGGGGQQAEGPDEDGWVRQMRFTIHR